MKEVWDLPNDDIIRPTDVEWLLRSLNEIIENHRVSMMIILWRIWHNHNEIMHEKPCPSIEGSRQFLMSYLNSLLIIKQFPGASVEKGKMVVDQTMGFHTKHASGEGQQRSKKTWKAPLMGQAKLNDDGAYSINRGAGIGMVLRGHQALSSWKHAGSCNITGMQRKRNCVLSRKD
jgi:hypothetical protein